MHGILYFAWETDNPLFYYAILNNKETPIALPLQKNSLWIDQAKLHDLASSVQAGLF
jgi:hypothetical protein